MQRLSACNHCITNFHRLNLNAFKLTDDSYERSPLDSGEAQLVWLTSLDLLEKNLLLILPRRASSWSVFLNAKDSLVKSTHRNTHRRPNPKNFYNTKWRLEQWAPIVQQFAWRILLQSRLFDCTPKANFPDWMTWFEGHSPSDQIIWLLNSPPNER